MLMLGVGFMVRVAGFGSEGPEFKSHSAVELIPGGVDSACHPSEVGKNECRHAGILCRSGDSSGIVPNTQGDCWGSTNALHRVWSQWMDGCVPQPPTHGEGKSNLRIVTVCHLFFSIFLVTTTPQSLAYVVWPTIWNPVIDFLAKEKGMVMR